MLDLQALGRELRERRRMLRITSAELARRIGVSPTYIWLIESASPRKNGLPSRPSEEVLRQWTQALGMGSVDSERMLALAGYFGMAADASRPASRLRREPNRALVLGSYDEPEARSATPFASAPPPAAAPMAMPPSPPADESAPDKPETDLRERLQRLLRSAERQGRTDEIAHLVRSHLQWLQHVIEDEDG